MLHEELVETAIGIELVEQTQELIHVHIVPAAIQAFLPWGQLLVDFDNLSVFEREVYSHAHRRVIGNAVLLPQALVILDDGVLLEGLKPLLNVLEIGFRLVIVIILLIFCQM